MATKPAGFSLIEISALLANSVLGTRLALSNRITPRTPAESVGGSPISTFLHVTSPLSKFGILAGSVLIALPMFGDYYTNDLISNSPRTSMIGNQINLFFQEGTQRTVGASLVIVLSVLLAVLMSYYLWVTVRASAETRESLL